MAEMKDILKKFKSFRIRFDFENTDEQEKLKELLKKLTLIKLENIKIDYHIKSFNLFQEAFPEFHFVPNLKIDFKSLSLILNPTTIIISFPLLRERSSESLRVWRSRISVFPTTSMTEKPEALKVEDLERIEVFIRSFLFSEILSRNLPELKEMSITFSIEVEETLDMSMFNELSKKNIFVDHKVNTEAVEFELEEENKDSFYFSLIKNENDVKCIFTFKDSIEQLFNSKIVDILQRCFEKYNEILGLMKL